MLNLPPRLLENVLAGSYMTKTEEGKVGKCAGEKVKATSWIPCIFDSRLSMDGCRFV